MPFYFIFFNFFLSTFHGDRICSSFSSCISLLLPRIPVASAHLAAATSDDRRACPMPRRPRQLARSGPGCGCARVLAQELVTCCGGGAPAKRRCTRLYLPMARQQQQLAPNGVSGSAKPWWLAAHRLRRPSEQHDRASVFPDDASRPRTGRRSSCPRRAALSTAVLSAAGASASRALASRAPMAMSRPAMPRRLHLRACSVCGQKHLLCTVGPT